jgi:hypothetical protein
MPAKLLHSGVPLIAAAHLVGLVGLEAAGALDPPLLRVLVLVVSVLLLQRLRPLSASHFHLMDRRLLLLVAIPAHYACLPLSRTQIIASSLHLSACPSPMQCPSLFPLCICIHPPESRTGTRAPPAPLVLCCSIPLSCVAQSLCLVLLNPFVLCCSITCSARAAHDKHACIRILESMTGYSFVSVTRKQRLLLLCMGGRVAFFLNTMFACNESWQSRQRLKYAMCSFKAHRASIPTRPSSNSNSHTPSSACAWPPLPTSSTAKAPSAVLKGISAQRMVFAPVGFDHAALASCDAVEGNIRSAFNR